MGGKYKSPARIDRSILRALHHKKMYLEDIWYADITIDIYAKKLIWNPSKSLKLSLQQNMKILEIREVFDPSFSTLPLPKKLLKFQNMWTPDQNSFTFFSSMQNHLKRRTMQCDDLCSHTSSPYCQNLTYLLSTNNWPDFWNLNLNSRTAYINFAISNEFFLLSHNFRRFFLWLINLYCIIQLRKSLLWLLVS